MASSGEPAWYYTTGNQTFVHGVANGSSLVSDCLLETVQQAADSGCLTIVGFVTHQQGLYACMHALHALYILLYTTYADLEQAKDRSVYK